MIVGYTWVTHTHRDGSCCLQVEKAPVVIKTAVSRADAEAMQKQLEAAGGKVVME